MQHDARIHKFRAAAERLVLKIEHERRPMTQNLTPKRNKQYRHRLWEADNLERARLALLALADAIEQGDCPPELAHLATPAQVAPLVHKGLDHRGYYDICPLDHYADQSPAGIALQSLLDSPRVATPEQSTDAIARKIDALEADARLSNIPGFFPTPPSIAARMATLADIQPFERVLEPSAGSGRLIDAAYAAQPDCDVDVCEFFDVLRRLLDQKRRLIPFEIVGEDFAGYRALDAKGNTSACYDVVLMNPPFEKATDIRHVLHAYENHLRPGGRLVAIVSSGALNRTDRLAQTFRALVDESSPNPDGIALPSGTFEDTGVAAVLIQLEKPPIDEPYEPLFPSALA